MAFRFLEHTADILFEAEGSTFEEALEEASSAISVAAAEKVKKKEEFLIEESAANIEELVVATLQRFLTECEIREILPGGIKVKEFRNEPGNARVVASCWGGKGKQKTIIKGVTYGMLKVEHNEKWRIRILLDI